MVKIFEIETAIDKTQSQYAALSGMFNRVCVGAYEGKAFKDEAKKCLGMLELNRLSAPQQIDRLDRASLALSATNGLYCNELATLAAQRAQILLGAGFDMIDPQKKLEPSHKAGIAIDAALNEEIEVSAHFGEQANLKFTYVGNNIKTDPKEQQAMQDKLRHSTQLIANIRDRKEQTGTDIFKLMGIMGLTIQAPRMSYLLNIIDTANILALLANNSIIHTKLMLTQLYAATRPDATHPEELPLAEQSKEGAENFRATIDQLRHTFGSIREHLGLDGDTQKSKVVAFGRPQAPARKGAKQYVALANSYHA